MSITQLLRDVLSIDDQTKLIDSAPTKLTNPYGVSDVSGLLEKLVGSEEGMGLATKALEKASTKNPTAKEYISNMLGGGRGIGGMLKGILGGLGGGLGIQTLPYQALEAIAPYIGQALSDPSAIKGIMSMLMRPRMESIRGPIPGEGQVAMLTREMGQGPPMVSEQMAPEQMMPQEPPGGLFSQEGMRRAHERRGLEF